MKYQGVGRVQYKFLVREMNKKTEIVVSWIKIRQEN